MTRQANALKGEPYWIRSRWFENDPPRKDASIRIKVGHDTVYEVTFPNVSEKELCAYGPTVLDLYLAGVPREDS